VKSIIYAYTYEVALDTEKYLMLEANLGFQTSQVWVQDLEDHTLSAISGKSYVVNSHAKLLYFGSPIPQDK